MPRRHNYLCLDCCLTAKRENWKTPVVCPQCGKYMSHQQSVPKKSDKKAWRILRDLAISRGWWTDRGDLETILRLKK